MKPKEIQKEIQLLNEKRHNNIRENEKLESRIKELTRALTSKELRDKIEKQSVFYNDVLLK